MTFYIKLSWNTADKKIFARLRKLTGKWSTKHPEVVDFRDRLLALQNYRCAYCQAGIEADENGYREIEHILPKNPSRNCTIAKGTNNATTARRSTLGYVEFCFEPRNLVLTCKQCNTLKGLYDPLKQRQCPRPLGKFPKPAQIEWFNPHFHKYHQHIHIDKNFLFSARSPGGAAVIGECGLDQAEVLEKKFQSRAHSRASHCADIRLAVKHLSTSVEAQEFSFTHAVNAISGRFEISTLDSQKVLTLCIEANSASDLEKLELAISSIGRQLQRKGKSARTASRALMKM